MGAFRFMKSREYRPHAYAFESRLAKRRASHPFGVTRVVATFSCEVVTAIPLPL